MHPRTRLLQLLRTPAIARLQFSVGSVYLHPADYARLEAAVFDGTIRIDPQPRAAQRIGSHVLAAYSAPANSILTTPLTSDDMLIHEATHAIVDLKGQPILSDVDETVAYLAGFVFALAAGPQQAPPSGVEHTETPQQTQERLGERFDPAVELAQALAATIRRHDMLRRRGAHIDGAELDGLRTAVQGVYGAPRWVHANAACDRSCFAARARIATMDQRPGWQAR